MSKPALGFVGAGRVGTALATLFSERGYPIAGIADAETTRAETLKGKVGAAASGSDASVFSKASDVLFFAVPDRAIKSLCDGLAGKGGFRKGQVVSHASGALGTSVLLSAKMYGAYTLSFHPLQSFAGGEKVVTLAGTYFALQGDSEALEVGKEMAHALDGFPVVIGEKEKPLYHAAASLLSNGLVALVRQGASSLERAGIKGEEAVAMVLPLLRGTLDHIEQGGVIQALTGPIERGDLETVKAHLKVLEERYPEGLGLYRTLSLAILGVAKEKASLSPEAQAELTRLFS